MPYRAFRWNLTATYLAPFILAVAMLTAFLLWSIQEQNSSVGWVEHSDQVIMQTKDAELQMGRMQLALRSYLYRPDQQFLNQLNAAGHEFARNLEKIAVLIADNPDQQDRLLQIDDLRESWIGLVENLINQKDSGTLGTDTFSKDRELSGSLQQALENFIVAEQLLRGDRKAKQTNRTRLLFVLVPLLSTAVMVFLSYWGWRQIQQASNDFQQALDIAEQAKARAEKANLAKNNFLGTVSHELRNPLNSIILWSATLLADEHLSENVRRGLGAIDRAVRAQTQLVDDLLDLARIESGRMRLDVQSVNLTEVVQAAVESMRSAVDAKSITLQEIVDPRVGPLAGDAGRLQQVVWNLLSNAVKFTPRGGRIQVRVERVNSHVELIVADNGLGIDPTSLPSVFDRFWQAEHLGKVGMGLGLSIVKEIVNLHGGSVSADSEGQGKGSTFTIRLPLPVSTVGLTELRRHPTVSPMAGTSSPRLDGFSIMVVDDDPNACEALEELLSSLGAQVTAATSTQAALRTLERTHPDAVVSDIGMPLRDGFDLAREIRNREQAAGNGRIPLVALTAYGRVEDKIKIFEAGFDNHLVKPVDPAELSAILGTVIASRREAKIRPPV